MFYGTAYATGLTTIRSGPNSLSFDISATTGKNTMVFIPLNSGLSVSEYSFVTFVNQDTTKDGEKKAQILPSGTSGTQLVLNIDLDVTPEAQIQLLIDPKAGDVIKGRGEGNLNMNLNAAGDFKITGDYTIEEGDYLFTLGNIFNKRFDVESGGMLTFNGDLENAEIDLRASYKNLKASLAPILPDLGDSRYNERIPVEPQIHLSGKLFNPFVKFDIYLPNADEETRTYLKNMITSEEELSRQFLFLLVMNSFYTDNSMANKPNTTSAGTSAMAATTTEMVSNQLSNWLSQISNDFDVGFNYRPGYGVNSQEVQVALSTQLLNDRVLINGNFGTGDAANYYGYPITGDFDVEYKITEKIRFKVFNRFNNNIYTGRGVPYTQGLGLFYKKDFNKFSDLFRKKEKSEPRKEDEITIEE
jgi:TamB, inner membrane protein subunit of TAM complex